MIRRLSTSLLALPTPLRRIIGLSLLVIWVLGIVMPVIPGWPALVLAIILLGRRDRMLRQLHLLGRRGLRWLRRHPIHPIRPFGLWLSNHYVNLRRAVMPHMIAFERRNS